MKIAIAGTGYVGLFNGILLAYQHEIVALDVMTAMADQINRKELSIEDAELEDYMHKMPLNFKVALNKEEAYNGASFVVIVAPTDCDPESNYFNTKTVESVIANVLAINP